jgi:hypothetical protein
MSTQSELYQQLQAYDLRTQAKIVKEIERHRMYTPEDMALQEHLAANAMARSQRASDGLKRQLELRLQAGTASRKELQEYVSFFPPSEQKRERAKWTNQHTPTNSDGSC